MFSTNPLKYCNPYILLSFPFTSLHITMIIVSMGCMKLLILKLAHRPWVVLEVMYF